MSKAKEQEKTMTAPTEAQLNDPAWWDENAPENANWLIRPRRSNTKNEAFFAITNTGHVGTNCDGESYHVMFEHWHFPVPRPTKPAAPEWDGEGLPPVGCECEFCYAGEGWIGRTCEVIAIDHDRDLLWLHLDGNEKSNLYRSDLFQFRPLRTAEQRQREKVIIKASQSIQSFDGISMRQSTSEELAAHLYDAGMLRKGDE